MIPLWKMFSGCRYPDFLHNFSGGKTDSVLGYTAVMLGNAARDFVR